MDRGRFAATVSDVGRVAMMLPVVPGAPERLNVPPIWVVFWKIVTLPVAAAPPAAVLICTTGMPVDQVFELVPYPAEIGKFVRVNTGVAFVTVNATPADTGVL